MSADNATGPAPSRSFTLIDFASRGEVAQWRAIDDGVMGGRSASRLETVSGYDPASGTNRTADAPSASPRNVAAFTGAVSLENNGGFASVRRDAIDADSARLLGSPVSAFVLRVFSDAHHYQFRVRMSDGFDGISYKAAFTPPAGQWSDEVLPVASFEAVFRGRKVHDAPPLDTTRIRQLAFMITSGQAGTFRLLMACIGIQRTS